MHPETLAGDATAARMIHAYRLDAKRGQRGAQRRTAAYVYVRAAVRLAVLVAIGAGGAAALWAGVWLAWALVSL